MVLIEISCSLISALTISAQPPDPISPPCSQELSPPCSQPTTHKPHASSLIKNQKICWLKRPKLFTWPWNLKPTTETATPVTTTAAEEDMVISMVAACVNLSCHISLFLSAPLFVELSSMSAATSSFTPAAAISTTALPFWRATQDRSTHSPPSGPMESPAKWFCCYFWGFDLTFSTWVFDVDFDLLYYWWKWGFDVDFVGWLIRK